MIIPHTTRDVLAYIDACQRERGTSPSLRELQLAFGYRAHSAVVYALALVEAQGYIVRGKHRARSITLTEKARALIAERETVE